MAAYLIVNFHKCKTKTTIHDGVEDALVENPNGFEVVRNHFTKRNVCWWNCGYRTTQYMHIPQHCTCSVRQYPWHDLNGFTINRRGEPHIPLHTYFDPYDLCHKNLDNNKVHGPHKIPNSILKNMPPRFHKSSFLFFKNCYKQKKIPTSWKTNLTILLYKKSNPSQFTNHRPVALYKHFDIHILGL